MRYQDEYARSIADPQAFWRDKANLIDWITPPKTTMAVDGNGVHRWYTDGELNTAWLCLDRHVERGRGEQVALIYDSPVTGVKARFTYRELLALTERFAGVLRGQGVGKGDRVVIYMPMIPEAAVAMLACARLGAIHSVVFGGFAAPELAVRIDDAKPRLIVSASCGLEFERVIPYKPLLDQALSLATHQPSRCIIVQRPQAAATMVAGRDIEWNEAMSNAAPAACVPVCAIDPLYILYTSGTTGKPKGVVRDNGGHAVALAYSMKAVYGIEPGEVFWAASDIGWVVGHSYIVYGPLLHGCTTILYEGKPVRTPDAGAFWRVIEEHRVSAVFAAPTAFRAIKKEDPDGKHLAGRDLSSLKTLFLAGERLDPATYEWVRGVAGLPVIDHWWQTESGWPMCGNPMGIEVLPTKAGSATVPIPGFDIRVLDPEGREVAIGDEGNIVVRLPLPPGCLPTLWDDHETYHRAYLETYPGYYLTGDSGYKDGDGYFYIMGRTDDIINIAGHRLSTGEIEGVVASHPAVAECVVVGARDEMKGQVPIGLIVLKNGVASDVDELERELVAMVREGIGAFACFRRAFVVERLPKTRSGKILRRIVRSIADGRDYTVPSTIEDATSLTQIEAALVGHREDRA